MSTFTTHSRPVRSERSTFVRRIDLSGGMRVTGLVEFPFEVHWLRDVHATAKLLGPNGREIGSSSTYCDWTGPLSAAVSALEAAAHHVASLGLGASTPLRAVVEVVIEERPVVPVRTDLAERYARSYDDIPDDWMRKDDPVTLAWLAAQTPDERADAGNPFLRRIRAWEGMAFDSRLDPTLEGQGPLFPPMLDAGLRDLDDQVAANARAAFLHGYAAFLDEARVPADAG